MVSATPTCALGPNFRQIEERWKALAVASRARHHPQDQPLQLHLDIKAGKTVPVWMPHAREGQPQRPSLRLRRGYIKAGEYNTV